MKRAILVVLMVVLVATPCFAQKIEPDGLFSIEGTAWRSIGVSINWWFPPLISFYDETVGFKDQTAFTPSGNIGIHHEEVETYLDFLVFSVALKSWGLTDTIMILQPTIGIGITLGITWLPFPPWGFPEPATILPIPSGVGFGFMFKRDESWTPPEYISAYTSISAEQGTTVIDFRLGCEHTTFQDNPPVEVSFDPPDGLTVFNINVKSNTRIAFDIKIAVDAPIGTKQIIVVYDNGNKRLESIGGGFKVLPISN